jgi:hypothetical protein
MSSDDERTMIGRLGVLVTLIVACADNNVLRIWCSSHQIDIVVKSTAEDINTGMWVKFAYMFSVLLRAEQLHHQHGVKCPKKRNRWVHLGRLLNFLK